VTTGRSCELAYRAPYDWDAALAFLARRATPGVETVSDDAYVRTFDIGGARGRVRVSRSAGLALHVALDEAAPHILGDVATRVRRVFDLDADPSAVAGVLGADPLLAGPLGRHPGLRTPGAWDGFELAVRAVLGQQVSVRGATTLAGRIAARWGTALAGPGLAGRLFPTAPQLASAALEDAGVLPSRSRTIRLLAERVADGRIALERPADVPSVVAALLEVPGIGDWTAQYVAMRALGYHDAFPSGDLVLRRAAGLSAPALARRSEAWRPWRAYAVMLLWQGATDLTMPVQESGTCPR
jgi:AraC family transcriptional regulator of adaptative response / DNA-3-methyladenine glycosylase II